ncbi:hypothetical protein RUND412_006341 [Rhizina undulata]
MQFTTLVLTFVTFVATAMATPQIYYCGTQPYYKSDYTCFAGDMLCPIMDGVVYLPCGAACYDPANYSCKDGALEPVGDCGGVAFDHNSYVCVDGELCPTGYPNRCGQACYMLSQYTCDNGVLKPV